MSRELSERCKRFMGVLDSGDTHTYIDRYGVERLGCGEEDDPIAVELRGEIWSSQPDGDLILILMNDCDQIRRGLEDTVELPQKDIDEETANNRRTLYAYWLRHCEQTILAQLDYAFIACASPAGMVDVDTNLFVAWKKAKQAWYRAVDYLSEHGADYRTIGDHEGDEMTVEKINSLSKTVSVADHEQGRV